jgi:asparagine synthase (glutamine-hydrolysing)
VFRAKSTFQSLARTPLEGYFCSSPTCPPGIKPRLFNGDTLRTMNGYESVEVLRAHYDRAGTPDLLSRLQYLDMKTYLADDILVKVDRASMANSLEVRCPLLDHKLMELIARMPPSLKLNRGTGKYLLKKSLERVLPSNVLYRSKKGFAVPVAEWFRGELKDFAHTAIFGRRDDVLNERFVKSCWNEHQRGFRDWSALLWCVLMFRTWQEVYRA